MVKVNAGDVGVAGSWGEVHTPQSSLTWGPCLPREIYVKEIREHNCPKLRSRDQGKELWRRINVTRRVKASESWWIGKLSKCVLKDYVVWPWIEGKKREEGKTEGWYSYFEGKKQKTAILPKCHYRDKMGKFGILSNYKDLQICIKYIPPS